MRSVFAIVFLLLPCLATAQRNAEADAMCFGLASHAEARKCLITAEAKSEQRLMQAEKDLVGVLGKWDEDEVYKKRSVAAHRLAISEFSRMREAQCDFLATLAAGGNGAGDRRLLCRIELNERHTLDLRALALSLR
jgi:hypothetical protein